jgi:hypothetical protein
MVNEAQGDPRQWPDPEQVTTPAEFAATMHAIRAASGMSYARLSVVTGDFSYPMSKSSVHALCTKPRLPSQRLAMESFLLACGASEDQLEPWRKAWQRVQQNSALPAPPAQAPADPPAGAETADPGVDEPASAEVDEVEMDGVDEVDDVAAAMPVAPVIRSSVGLMTGDSGFTLGSPPRARHAQPMPSWESVMKEMLRDPMRFARAITLVVLVVAGATVLVAFALHWISTLP